MQVSVTTTRSISYLHVLNLQAYKLSKFKGSEVLSWGGDTRELCNKLSCYTSFCPPVEVPRGPGFLNAADANTR